MYAVSEGTKKLHMGQMDDSNYTPVYKIVFPDDNFPDIKGQNIIQGTPEVEQSLWDGGNVCLGGCISSCFRVTLAETDRDAERGISEWFWSPEMLGRKIRVYTGYEEAEIICIYEGYIKTGQRQDIRSHINVVCYDAFTMKFDRDVSYVYNNLFPESELYEGVWQQGKIYKSGYIVKDETDGNYYMINNCYENLSSDKRQLEYAVRNIMKNNSPSALQSEEGIEYSDKYGKQTGSILTIKYEVSNILYGTTVNTYYLVRCLGDNIGNIHKAIPCGELLRAVSAHCGFNGNFLISPEMYYQDLYKTMEASNLSGRACVAQIAEALGYCAYITENGNMGFRKLENNRENAQVITEYEKLVYNDFLMMPIDGVCVKDSEGNTYYYPEDTSECKNIYTINENFVFFKPHETIIYDPVTYMQNMLKTIYERIKGFSYRGFSLDTWGMPWLEVGDTITFIIEDGTEITTIVQSRTLKGTTGALRDSFSAECEEATCKAENTCDFSPSSQLQGNTYYLIKEEIKKKLTVEDLTAELAKFNIITAGEADLKYANIGLTNIQDGTIKNAMIGDAQISFEKVDQSFINDLTADNIFTQYLKSLVGEFGFISADEAALKYTDIYLSNIDIANINKTNIGLLFNAVGLLDRATIVDGHVTGFLDSVEVNAGKITSGTLATDRLIIRNPDDPTKSIIYEINNITGALQAAQGETINGEVMTPRTVNADKLIAGSVTTTELDVAQIFADSAVLRQIFTQDITATGTIRGVNLIGVYAEIEQGKIGGWAIKETSLSSHGGNNSLVLYSNGKIDSDYCEIQNGKLVTETYKSLTMQSGEIHIISGAGSNKDNYAIDLSLDDGLQLNYAKDTWIKISGGSIQTKYGEIVGYSTNGFVIRPESADAGEIGGKGCYFKTMYSSKYALRDTTYGIEIGTTSSGGSSGVRIGDLSGGNGSYTYITNDCVAQHAMRVEGNLTVNGGSATLGNSSGTVHIPGTLDNPVFNAIGEYVSNSYAVSIQSTNVDSYTSGASVTLTAGTYVIVADGIFASNQSTATRRVAIYAGSSLNSFVSQTSQWYTRLQCISVVKLSAITTVSCRISAGVVLSGCNTLIKAVRIK